MCTHRFAVALLVATTFLPTGRPAGAADRPGLPPATTAGDAAQGLQNALRQGPDLKVVRLFQTTNYPYDYQYDTAQPFSGQVKVGDTVAFVCDAVNLGPAIDKTWMIGYFVDGQPIWNNTKGAVPVNGTVRGVASYKPKSPGAHTFRCQLDFHDDLRDRDPSNNEASVTFSVAGKIKKPPTDGPRKPIRR